MEDVAVLINTSTRPNVAAESFTSGEKTPAGLYSPAARSGSSLSKHSK